MAEYEQVGTRNPDGMKFGAAATDKIGFYGTAPAVQPVNTVDATDASSALALVNVLNANLKTLGLKASA